MSSIAPEDSRTRKSLLGSFLERPPHLTPDLERRFQADYYTRIHSGLRLVSLLLAGLVAVQVPLYDHGPPPSNTIQIAFWLCVLGLTWVNGFRRFWQPTLVLLGWATAEVVLGELGHMFARDSAGHTGPVAHFVAGMTPSPVPQQEFFFMLQMAVLMVSLSTLRLPFRWTALLQCGVLMIGLWNLQSLPDPDLSKFARFVVVPALIVLLVLLLAAFTQERLARSAFWSACQLEEERDGERRQREQTEGQLKVLARAIGGIVHDLGGPMTVVMMGADILAMEHNSSDVEAIQEAGQMLAALRVSLIEQTRVLEGKSIPVDLRAESLRSIIESGTRFQNSRLIYKRTIALDGEDHEVSADRLKLATVFMNLISNALKYSDGEVRIAWQVAGDVILIGVMDRGTSGQGITPAQAQKLFVAFGRLDTHVKVEGTGLGLISARKIVEAHGGEVFVEGHQDGTADSPRFATATCPYPSLLPPGFLTGFVIALPVRPVRQDADKRQTPAARPVWSDD